MTADARVQWNARYRAWPPRFEPSPLLVQYADLLAGGRALDVACGTGRNALFLAEQGYYVDAIDISEVGLSLARVEARRRGLAQRIRFVQADVEYLPLTPARVSYDCIVVFRFFLRSVIPVLRQCLKPGGLMVYSTFNVRRLQSHPDFNPAHLVGPGELPTWFPGFDVIAACNEGEISTFVGRSPQAPGQAARSSAA